MEESGLGPCLEIDPSKFVIVLGPTFTAALLHQLMLEDVATSSSSPASTPKVPGLDLSGLVKEGIAVLLDSEQFSSNGEKEEREYLYKRAFGAEPPMEKLTSSLQQCGRYVEWLNRSFRLNPMPSKSSPVLNHLIQLQDRGSLLAYTGCDDALSKIANLQVLLPEDMAEWCSGEQKGFMNVHGVYWKPDSLQLNCEVYKDPSHPARHSMEQLRMVFKEKYVISIGVCDSQLDNLMMANFTRTFLAVANSHHCFDLAMHPLHLGVRKLDVGLLHLPLPKEGSQPGFTVMAMTEISRVLCNEIDFPSIEQQDHQVMSLLVSNKQGASEISKLMSLSPGVNFALVSSVDVSGHSLSSISLLVEGSKLRELWVWLWEEKTSVLESKGLLALVMQSKTIIWLKGKRPPGYPTITNQSGKVEMRQPKSEFYPAPMETAPTMSKTVPKLNPVNPALLRQDFPIPKPGTKKIPRYTVHRLHVKPPVPGLSLTLPADCLSSSSSSYTRPHLHGFSDDTNMYSQDDLPKNVFARRCSLPPNIRSNPGSQPDSMLSKLAESCQCSSSELHPPSYTAIKQALLCDKYKRRQSMQTDPKTLKNLLQTKLVISDKNDLVNLRRKSDPGSYMKQRDFDRRKELFLDENMSWSKSYGKVIDQQIQNWERKRQQKLQRDLLSWKHAGMVSSPAYNPLKLQVINPAIAAHHGIINPLQGTSNGLNNPSNTLFPSSFLNTTSGGVINPYVLSQGVISATPGSNTSIYYNPFGTPYTFNPYSMLQIGQVPQPGATYLVPQANLAPQTGQANGFYYLASSTATNTSDTTSSSSIATATMTVPINSVSTNSIPSPSPSICLFAPQPPPTIKTPPTPSPPSQELYVPRPLSPNSRKRHQSVPEKLTSLLQPPSAISSRSSSPMEEENSDSPPLSKKQRSTSDTTVYHTTYRLSQHSSPGQSRNSPRSPHSHGSPQPPIAEGGQFDGLSALQTHLLQVHQSYNISKTAVEERQNRRKIKSQRSNGKYSPKRKHSGGVVKDGSTSPNSSNDADEVHRREITVLYKQEREISNTVAADRFDERRLENILVGEIESQQGSVNGSSRIHLWEFLLELLVSDHNLLHWTDNEFEFQITKPTEISQLWGQLTNNSSMNYEMLISGLKFYFNNGLMSQVMGRKLTYRFAGHIRNYVQTKRSQMASSHEEVVVV